MNNTYILSLVTDYTTIPLLVTDYTTIPLLVTDYTTLPLLVTDYTTIPLLVTYCIVHSNDLYEILTELKYTLFIFEKYITNK
jgi:hypothetical protein